MLNLIEGPIAYQIAVTYRCNSACRWCVQHLDVVRWDHVDTDITVEEIELGADLVRRFGITVGKLRVTGGEPVLHPNLVGLLQTVKRRWKPTGWFRTYSNGKLPLPKLPPTRSARSLGRFSVVPVNGWKKDCFLPFNVSPADLGMEPVHGFLRPCEQQLRCGRWFDCFGFTSCGVAGVLGTMLGEECYEPLPVMLGRPSVCQHCIHTLPKKESRKLATMAHEGKVPGMTETYRRAIERWRDDPPRPRRIWERLPGMFLSGSDDGEKERTARGCSERGALPADVPLPRMPKREGTTGVC